MAFTKRIIKGAPLSAVEYDGNTDETIAQLATKVATSDARLSDSRNPLAHTQAISTVTGLQAALDLKATITSVTAVSAIAAAKVDSSDSRLTNARSIANGTYGDFSVDAGVATIPRTPRALVTIAGYDVAGLPGTMLLGDTAEVVDTIQGTQPSSNLPRNFSRTDLTEWLGDDMADWLTLNAGFGGSAATGVGLWRAPVRVVAASNVTLSTAIVAGQTVSGVVLAANDMVLVVGQTTGSQNGVYIVQASGAPVRQTDADSDTDLRGAIYYVTDGYAAGAMFRNTNASAITVGTTALTYGMLAPGQARGADVAAAATVALGSGRIFHITGTGGPITDLDFVLDFIGRWAIVIFDAAASVTNGSNLLTPNAEDFTATAGDAYLIVSEGSDLIRMYTLKRARQVLALGDVTGNFSIPIKSYHSGITVRLTGNSTINAISGLIDGGLMGTIELFVTQDGTGSRTLSESVSPGITPIGADALTLTITANATTILLLQGSPGGNFFIMNTGRSY